MSLARADITAELRGPLLVLLVVAPLLALAGWLVYGEVQSAAAHQTAIRDAQNLRARALHLQVDEETAIRGYSATGDTVMLQPYLAARADLTETFIDLKAALRSLGLPAGTALASDEARANTRWLATIAKPLLGPSLRSPQTTAVLIGGKAQVDHFRDDDAGLQDILNDAAAAADRATARSVANLLLFTIAALIVLAAGAAAFGFLQARSARRAFEDRIRYENQKRIADALQTAFLNRTLPATPGLGLHATYIPATLEAQVGGDWYDAFELPDRRILFSIGDVAGHGLEAAVVMSRARQAIIAAALHENDPAAVLTRANAAILLQESPMITAICGYIDPATFEVTYATAGHPPPILARSGQASVFLPHDGLPLGVMAGAAYRTFVATASDGAMLVLYTDGVIEHKRDVIEGEARLLEATRLTVDQADPALAIQRYIFATAPPADDVAILTVTFKARAGRAPRITELGALHYNRLEVEAPFIVTSPPETALSQRTAPSDDIDLWLRRLVGGK